MNKLTLIAASLLSVVAATASAQSLSRADVVAELERARASGELAAMQSEFKEGALSPSLTRQTGSARPLGKTRAEVLAELKLARATGELDLLHAEGGPDATQLAEVRRKQEALLAGQPRNAR